MTENTQGLIPRSRSINLCVAVVLVVLLLPLIALLACLGRVLVGPEYLCRHARLGLDSTPFQLLNFRSIPLHDTDQDSVSFKYCQLMGATGLATLPQIFNVIRGEMNLIGPYPLPPHINVGEILVKPGMFQQSFIR